MVKDYPWLYRLRENNGFKRFIDKAIYAIGLFGPIMTMPQLYKIYIGKNAIGVSALSWTGYLISSLFWLAYGLIHKDKPITITSLIYLILNSLVVIGTLIYG